MPQFDVQREVILPATPEDVWAAVATTEGQRVLAVPVPIDPEQAVGFDPPHRFATRMEQGEWFNALEFVLEGHDGAQTKLRYAHSGVFVDDWDRQFDAVQQHTDFYLHTLSQYLEHFNGRKVTYIGTPPTGVEGPPSSTASDGFHRLLGELGVSTSASEGQQVTIAPEGLDPVQGTIDYLRANFLGVRTSDALYRFFGRNAFGAPVAVSIHAFYDVPDAHAVAAQWFGWMEQVLG